MEKNFDELSGQYAFVFDEETETQSSSNGVPVADDLLDNVPDYGCF